MASDLSSCFIGLILASTALLPHPVRAATQELHEVFGRIYAENSWESDESRSGPGSSLAQTRHVREAVEEVIKSLGIARVLDAACGDFSWMRLVNMHGASYTGMDVVPALIEHLQSTYGTEDGSRSFVLGDMTTATLPASDLIIARDVLGHLSAAHGLQALRNFKASGARWLLTTSFAASRCNFDIPDGDWRAVNLAAEPYALGAPAGLFVENGVAPTDQYSDKALALYDLWAISP